MIDTILLGEKNALFFSNALSNKGEVIKLEEILLKKIPEVRILSNRTDIELSAGFIPKVLPWQMRLVKKSYILGKTSENNFFNSKVNFNVIVKNKYKTQDISMIPDDISAKFISHFNQKVYGIEHIAFIVPKIIKTSGYWIFLGENILGDYSIYCGHNEFILFTRLIKKNLESEIAETMKFLERYGYIKDQSIQKISICNKEIPSFNNIHQGYSDQFLTSEVLKLNKFLFPTIGPKNWVKQIKQRCFSKYISYTLLSILSVAIIATCVKYHEYHEIKNKVNITHGKIAMLAQNADKMIINFAKQLKTEMDEFKLLEEEFDKLRNSLHVTGNYDPQLITHINSNPIKKESHNRENSHQNTILLNSNRPILLLKKLEYLFPKNMHIHGYSYNTLIEGQNNTARITIYTNSEDQIIKEFVKNINSHINGISDIHTKKINKTESAIEIKFDNTNTSI